MTEGKKSNCEKLDRVIEVNNRVRDETLNLIKKRGREIALFFRDKVELKH